MLRRYQSFGVTHCCLIQGEDGGIVFLSNVSEHSADCTVSHLRRSQQKSEIWLGLCYHHHHHHELCDALSLRPKIIPSLLWSSKSWLSIRSVVVCLLFKAVFFPALSQSLPPILLEQTYGVFSLCLTILPVHCWRLCLRFISRSVLLRSRSAVLTKKNLIWKYSLNK